MSGAGLGDATPPAQTVALIDLGEDWVRRAPEPTRRRVRSGRVPLVLLSLVLLAGTAASGVTRGGLSSLFSVPIEVASIHVLDGDTLYVTRDRALDAYRLPAGTRAWSARIGRPVSSILPVPAAGVVLAEYGADTPNGMLALDARTGRVRWRADQASLVGAVTGGSRALVVGVNDVRAVSVPTGRTIWQRPQGQGLGWTYAAGDPARAMPPRLAFDNGDGVTEVVDAATGRVVARSLLETRWPAESPGEAAHSSQPAVASQLAARSIVGDQLFLAHQQADTTLLDAYDLATLAHQWRTQVGRAGYFVAGCGPVLCVTGFDSTTGLDPRSGAVLWTSHNWQDVRPMPGSRLLVSGAGADSGGPTAVVDATSMRPLLALPGWNPLTSSAGQTWLLGRDTGQLRTWFAVLRPGRPAIEPLGSAWGVQTAQCEYNDRYLACPTVRNTLEIWRYQAPTGPDRA